MIWKLCQVSLFLFISTQVVDYAQSSSAPPPSNILVITFFSSKSHKITYLPLIEALGKRGHNVTVVSPIKPMKQMQNVKEIFTIDVEKLFQNDNFNAFEMKEKGTQMDPSMMIKLAATTCELSYDLPIVQQLLNEKFDLIFIQPLFNDCLFGLIYRLKAPFVLFTPTQVPSFYVSKVGGHFPPSFNPNFLVEYPSEMTFYQRFINFGVNTLLEVFWKYMFEASMENIYREKLGADIPGVGQIIANASLILSNGHFSLAGPKPYFPDVIDVGGIHSVPAKPIPNELQEFINKGKDGFIVFSMGSAIKGDMMPESKRKMILNVFSKLKQQVFWKWESETMPDLPKNVQLRKWLPLQDLLGHKDIKLFITHCGGGSTEESIYHGVPIVGIPMMADQPKNAKLAEQFGFIVRLDWNSMTEQDFEGAILEVLNNPKYRENVKKISTIFKDRPMHPLDLGVYWIEYVLKHKGAPQLRSKAAREMSVIQYHSVDVIATYLLLFSALLYLIIKTIKFVIKIVLGFLFKKSKAQSITKGKKHN